MATAAQNVPQELLDFVLGEYRPENRIDRRNIARYGLVCKNWLPSSRYRLFADVQISDRTMDSFVSIAQNSPLSIPNFIRSLKLSSRRADNLLDENLRRLGSFPRVETLRISMTDAAFHPTLIATMLPDISTLVFENCQLRLSSILHAVAASQSLQTLRLDWVTLSYGTPLPSPFQPPPQLRALSLDLQAGGSGSNPAIDTFFETILSLHPIPLFSSLSVRRMHPKEHSFLTKYLSHAGDSVHYLRFVLDGNGFFCT